MERTNYTSHADRQIKWTPARARVGKLLFGWLASVLTISILITSMGHGVAFAADGDLDPTFSGDGKVTTDFGTEDWAGAVAMQADGKIVAAGQVIPTGGSQYNFALARYLPDGTLDATFSGDGKVTTDFGGHDAANAVAVQADGKIVVAGTTEAASGNWDFALARYNSNGTLDTTFSGDGLVTTTFTSVSSDQAISVAIAPNGAIVASGITDPDDSNGPWNFAMTRYNPNGTLDTTFGFGGKVATDFGGNDYALDMAIGEDGKIVLAGSTGISPGDRDFALARYNTNGTLDSNFSGDGKLTTNFTGSSNDGAGGVAITSDGKIVAAGSTGLDSIYDFALARYNPDGSLDPAFSGDGKVITAFASGYDDGARDVAIQADGKIVAAGRTASDNLNNYDFGLARYLPNGILDTTFSFDGMVSTDFGGNIDYAQNMVIGADGKIVLAGLATFGSNNLFGVARYLSSGAPTPTPTSTSAPTHTSTPVLPTQTPGGPTATPIACIIQFSDVPPDNTFYTHIRCLACRNIIGGYSDGTFRPGNDITRGQLSKIISNASGFSEPVAGQTFSDVAPDHTFYEFIERLVSRGIIGGYADGTFRPGNNATRGQISKIVSNARGFSEPVAGQIFSDVPPTHTFYEFIGRLVNRGIISGYSDGTFRPGNNATRGQASKIIANAYFPNCQTSGQE